MANCDADLNCFSWKTYFLFRNLSDSNYFKVLRADWNPLLIGNGLFYLLCFYFRGTFLFIMQKSYINELFYIEVVLKVLFMLALTVGDV